MAKRNYYYNYKNDYSLADSINTTKSPEHPLYTY